MKRLYVVRDLVAEAVVGGVMTFPGDPAAVRSFQDAMRNPETVIAQHPADFDLLCVGVLEEGSGQVVGHPDGPTVVITGAAMMAAQTLVKEGTA